MFHLRFVYVSYLFDIEDYLQIFHVCNIKSITNPTSYKVLMNAVKWRMSRKQFEWIIRTLKKVKTYILNH